MFTCKPKRASRFDNYGRKIGGGSNDLFSSGANIVVKRAPMALGLTVPKSSLCKPFQRPMTKRRAYDKAADRALKTSSLGQRRRMDGMSKLMARAGKGLTYRLPQRNSGDCDGDDSDSDQEDDVKEDEKPFEPLCVWVSPHEGGEAKGLPPVKQIETQSDEFGVEEEVEVVKPPPASAYSKKSVYIPPILAKWLRPHQREGVSFLYECVMSQRNFAGAGCILADDMGLGKTLQSVVLIYTLLQTSITANLEPTAKRIIVICPCSLVKNWDNEFVKWLGPGGVRTLAIADQDRKTVEKNIDIFVKTKMFKILIASYECIRTHVGRLNKHKNACDLLICDEAHRLKNRDNQTSRALNSLQVKRRVLLTGTPMQNDLSEFYAMVDFTNPGILGTEEEFRRKILNPILRGREPDATAKQKQKMMDIQQNMSNIVNEFILRRINTLNAQHLPPKLVQVVCCKLTDMQRNIYQHLVTSKDLQHLQDGKQQNCLSSIQMLMKLCNHPKLVADDDTSSSRGGGRRGNKKISYAEDGPSSAAPGADGISKFLPYSSGNGVHPEWSGKMFVLYRLLYEMRRPGNGNDKIVIISNYTQTLDLIGKMCKQNNWKSCRLDGSVGMKKRQAMVDEFNDPSSSLVAFLLSSKAGGCGINLIGGNRLVLFDPDWNPAVDKQAAARCWREGQKKRCFTYRFLAAGTVEEKIFQRQLSKEGLQSIVDDKEQVNVLSSKDLQKLFKLREDTPSDTHDKLNCQRCKLTKDNAEEMDLLTLPKRLSACKVLLEVMMEREDAQYFIAPLDPTQYDVTKDHYENLVKQPMDLGTVMAKLSRTLDQLAKQQESSLECKPVSTKISGYESASQFSKDVNRIFANIAKVWAPECELADASRMLQSWWLEQWTGLVPNLMNMKPDDNDGKADDENDFSDLDKQQQRDKENGTTATDEINERGEDYQEQIGMPDEENMRSWSHHFSTDTCDDPIFRAAMRGFDSVSFVFGLEVTWSLIQQRQQEEEEQKAMQALKQLQACENNDDSNAEDSDGNDSNDDDSDDNDKNSNNLASAKKRKVVELVSTSDEESDDDGSVKNDGDEESWNLLHVLSPDEILKSKCQTDDCDLRACSVWKSDAGEKWSTCLDCQSQDFGEWPKNKKPSDFEMGAIVKHCTKVGEFIVEDDEESENENNDYNVEDDDKIEEELELIDDDVHSDEESFGDNASMNSDSDAERGIPQSVDKENQINTNSTLDGTNPEDVWTCTQCTYGNKSSAKKCGICTASRPNKRPSDVSSPMSIASSRARLS